MADTKVERISRLAQWRVESFGPCTYKKSEAFKVGIWNWHLSIEKSRYLYVRLFPEPSRLSKEQPPLARFILRLSGAGANRAPHNSHVQERILRNGEDFLWPVDCHLYGRFVIDVEFLDLKIVQPNGWETKSAWSDDGSTQSMATQAGLKCLSRMLHENIHTDITITTSDGTLRAHKAVLGASSPVFHSMFLHDLAENRSSNVDIDDMSHESCKALLSYIYGEMKQEEFWRHRGALLRAADKYDMADLKEACEESLLEDIGLENVLERLEEAWMYRLQRLKKGCFAFLFEFGKIHDVKDEMSGFFKRVHKDLMVEMFMEVVSIWKPL